ncbi:DUF1080 domain-containing protein [Flavobacteriaceae bacterium KMM 6898]|nr:DUF1080 domain-containing protein [Flavobacteriaceae bacterium KMM 6898]
MKVIMGITCLLLVVSACKHEKKQESEAVHEPVEIVINEWVSLMDSTKWRGYNMDHLPSNWKIGDGVIECFGKAGDMGGDIITNEQFENFELQLNWKISQGGNSGVFYNVIEDTIYHSPYQTGPEYQLLDDVGFPEPIEDWQKTGADYAMFVANNKKSLKPVGEWNTTKIIVNKGKVEHWLNGEKIVEFDRASEEWKEKRNSGKWIDYPDYGMGNSGHLALQDHGAGVWFKDVKVKRL